MTTPESGGQPARRDALSQLQAENRQLAETLETVYRMNRDLEIENEKLKQQLDTLLDRLNRQGKRDVS